MVDTSPEYIKMCQKAEEVQAIQTKILPLTKGNWFVMESDHEVVIVRDGAMMVIPPAIRFIWLPRQDQLQEMVGGFKAGFVDWWHWKNAVYPHMQSPYNKEWRFTSFEQLWLAFVMKEKFGKVWTGEKWVSEKSA